MKNTILAFGLMILLPVAALAEPTVTVLANSVDLALSSGYLDNLQASGITVTAITANQLSAHKSDPNILILGGQNAPEGVGAIVASLLTESEKKEVVASPDAKAVVIVPEPWAPNQKVTVFAGYEKEQTRKAFGDAQGDIMKSLRFNDNIPAQGKLDTSGTVPPIDHTQPYTEVTAQQAFAIIKNVADVEVIDVRGKPFYDAGHIPGAVSMDQRTFDQNVDSLDKAKTYLLYCGGNSQSIKVGGIMAQKGFKRLYRLVDGYIAWRKAGYSKDVTASL